MLSPLFGFTDDEIAAIRLVRRKVPFFTALTEAAEQGGHPAEFLETFEALRRRRPDGERRTADYRNLRPHRL